MTNIIIYYQDSSRFLIISLVKTKNFYSHTPEKNIHIANYYIN
jgi:hypothetical protein